MEKVNSYAWSSAFTIQSNEALGRATDWLAEAPIPRQLAEFLAEDMAREFLVDLDRGKRGPRGKESRDKLDMVVQKTNELLGAWRSLDQLTRTTIAFSWLAESEYKDLPPSFETLGAFRLYAKVLEDSLAQLSAAARLSLTVVPQDQGGAANWAHDPTGKSAQTRLALVARHTLRVLMRKAGGGKGGPLSCFIGLINQAATGEEGALWTDKAAERVCKRPTDQASQSLDRAELGGG
ncbi:MAG: hypothetical protein HY014_05375 [Acidobacteria bacterium]|nr:hypothetical protein [Acidobacteriota bacterium]MBI3487583.1 hypothetical protein [Acidobacteriota bacterium]